MAKAAYPTIGIAAFVMFVIVYFIGCLRILDFPALSRQTQKQRGHLKIQKSQLTRNELVGLIFLFNEYP